MKEIGVIKLDNIQYEKFFFELIVDEKVGIQYLEEEGEAKIAFTMEKDTDEYFKDNPEIFDRFIDYVQQCLVVANYAGFEAPSEFYTAIKAYVESEGDGIL